MLSLHEIILRLTVAAALGAVIGLERVVRRRPAGVRTSLFVCLATALFTILSNELAHRFGDSSGTRIASNIVPRHYQPCRECCHGSSAADGEPEDSHATLPRFDGGRKLYCGI